MTEEAYVQGRLEALNESAAKLRELQRKLWSTELNLAAACKARPGHELVSGLCIELEGK